MQAFESAWMNKIVRKIIRPSDPYLRFRAWNTPPWLGRFAHACEVYKSPQGGILLRRLRGVNIVCYADILEHVQTANCRIGEPGSQ